MIRFGESFENDNCVIDMDTQIIHANLIKTLERKLNNMRIFVEHLDKTCKVNGMVMEKTIEICKTLDEKMEKLETDTEEALNIVLQQVESRVQIAESNSEKLGMYLERLEKRMERLEKRGVDKLINI